MTMADRKDGDGAELPTIKTVRTRNLKTSERVARQLVSYIIDEEIPEGTTLPPERLMLKSLNVGRTTLREALRLLETRGVITMRSGPGGGPIVRKPRPQDLSEALTLTLQYETASFLDVMDARLWLEPTLARLAASNVTEEALDSLRAANAEIASADANLDAFSGGNQAFHSIIAALCGNVVLEIFAATLMAIGDGRMVGISYGKKHTQAIAKAHEVIIDALAAGDPDAAQASMEVHLQEANTYWRTRYSDLLARPIRWTQETPAG